MSTFLSPLPGTASQILDLPATPDVSDELGRAGASFGSLVELTGNAVAQTQLQLTQTSAATATTLANTVVDVIAVQETKYDEFGAMTDGVTYVRRLPLINFVDPVFYEWTQVRLQGQFFAQEIASASSREVSTTTRSSGSGQSGFLVFLGLGSNGRSSQISTTTTDTDASADYSYGRLRMYAQLNPKTDIGVPKPRQIVQGPSVAIMEGEIQDVLADGKLVARTASAMVELRRRDGTPIPNKMVSIETDGIAWSFTGAQLTDATGRVSITLRREFLGTNPDTTPVDVVVTARLGMVANNTTMRL